MRLKEFITFSGRKPVRNAQAIQSQLIIIVNRLAR